LKSKVKNAERDYGKTLQRSRKGSCKELKKARSVGFEAINTNKDLPSYNV
jgi:hypothetical protein